MKDNRRCYGEEADRTVFLQKPQKKKIENPFDKKEEKVKPEKEIKNFFIHIDTDQDSIQATAGSMPKFWCFYIQIGGIVITPPRIGKPGIVHIRTGRKDSLEGGDFKVEELEKAIQDFFDRNF